MKVMNTLKKFAAIGTGAVMLGATLTGALAQDLKDYPKPFVTNGVYDDSNVFVYGDQALADDTAAMMDIAASLQFLAKTPVTTAGSAVTVTGGKSQQVPLGQGLSNTTYLDKQLQDDDISTLFDGKVTFKGTEYDTSEEFQLCDENGQKYGEPFVATSLQVDDDYKKDTFFYTGADKIRYAYKFDKAINLSSASNTDPLEISFLGKTIKITGITATSITAKVGDEYTLNAGQTATVEGKVVKIENVGSTSAAISIDGVSKTITTSSSSSWNGLEVYLDSVMNRNTLEESAAVIVVGKQAVETYNDGDAFIGEDTDDPNWVWDIRDMTDATASGYLDCGDASDAMVLRVENDLYMRTASDNPVGVGKCIDLPNQYLSLCLDSLTVSDADYKEYTFEWGDTMDVTDVNCGTTFDSDGLVPGIKLTTDASEGLDLRSGAFAVALGPGFANVSGNVKTKEVTLVANGYMCNNSEVPGGTGDVLNIFYKSTESPYKLKWFGAVNASSTAETILARFNNGNTKDDNIKLITNGVATPTGYWNLKLKITPDTAGDIAGGYEYFNMTWGRNTAFTGLGATKKFNDASELFWVPNGRFSSTDISSIDKDQMSSYGVIVRDPKSGSSSDRVQFLVPSDQVKANVVIKGSAAIVTSGSTSYVPSKISPVYMKAGQVTDPTKYNLIVVGGPCANTLAGSLFGLTCDGWAYKEGEAVVKLVNNGEKVAMLVAGTTALDTQRAGKAVANYDKYAFTGAEKLVKGTTLQDITVE